MAVPHSDGMNGVRSGRPQASRRDSHGVFCRIDVSLELSSVCVVDATGKIAREAKVASEPPALIALFDDTGFEFTRIGLEAGPLSNDDLIARRQPLAKAFERRAGHVDPTEWPQSPLFPDDQLRKSAVDVHADHGSQSRLLSLTKRERGATRHLRIRALGATGRIAEAASY